MTTLLSADDLNDFIAPGVACIKEEEKPSEGHIQLEFEFDAGGDVVDKSSQKKLSKAQVSLTDCLACSGCITSMEEVLVAQHSHSEFLKALENTENADRIWALSVSQQARASLAQAYNVSMDRMDRVLGEVFAREFGFTYVVSVGVGRELTIGGVEREVKEILKGHGAETSANMGDTGSQERSGPLLLSVCPGWVLYVEKTHPELVPLMSGTKSPQGITGALLKAIGGSKVYHLSVMPCFDKKLEAARDKDSVDCVITPREIVLMMEERGIDLAAVAQRENLPPRNSRTPSGWYSANDYGWGTNEGSTSGGYAHSYIRAQQKQNPGSSVRVLTGRNNDIYELQVVSPNGSVEARAGVVNGFKNIQNLVRKLKPDNGPKVAGSLLARRRRGRAIDDGSTAAPDLSKCQLLEIMACPSGCINGGGQIKAPEGTLNNTWLEAVSARYTAEHHQDSPHAWEWLDTLCADCGVTISEMLYMEVKAVEKVADDPMEMFTSTW